MLKTILILLIFVTAGCRRQHTGSILHFNPYDNLVIAVQSIQQPMDNTSGKSAGELIMELISSYNEQNNTNFTTFISNEPMDISQSRVIFDGILVEIRQHD